MILSRALRESADILHINGVEEPHIEARMLMGHVTKMSPVQIYTEPGQVLSREKEDNLRKLLVRRLNHEPAAYILNHKEFYGIDFFVDSRVLIPRPDTEKLVDVALELARSRNPSLGRPLLAADVGTGCGAIAISLALSLPQAKIYATDLSTSALEVAELNCRLQGVAGQVSLLPGDMLQPLPEPVDLIVTNLPYIKNSEMNQLSPEIIEFEPRAALDGGQSGLDYIRRLLLEIKDKIISGGYLVLEIGQNQDKEVTSLIHKSLGEIDFEFIKDLNGINRVVKIGL